MPIYFENFTPGLTNMNTLNASYSAEKLVNEFGLSLAETARQLGVTTAPIANPHRRKKM